MTTSKTAHHGDSAHKNKRIGLFTADEVRAPSTLSKRMTGKVVRMGGMSSVTLWACLVSLDVDVDVDVDLGVFFFFVQMMQ